MIGWLTGREDNIHQLINDRALVTVLTHEQHMTPGAWVVVLAFVGFGGWMVVGTVWWVIGLVVGRRGMSERGDGDGKDT